jgi:hypothetical protein
MSSLEPEPELVAAFALGKLPKIIVSVVLSLRGNHIHQVSHLGLLSV